jgi:hypothetical protein
MGTFDIVHHRLNNQQLSQRFEQPGQVVAHFGAMQAQDYVSAKWAVGLRCRNATDATIEQTIANTIVRTWLMRGTLHFVTSSDLRWMLTLLGPRLIDQSARRYRQLDLDDTIFAHSDKTLTMALQGSNSLTRAEIMHALEQAGISTKGQRGYHILRRAGLAGLICFGPMQGKQETFVLIDEWLPPGKVGGRDEALVELATRYFNSHGPATLQDFVWWSGLPVADSRAGLEAVKNQLQHETIEGQIYWLPENQSVPAVPSPMVCLLPAYDEYFLGYKNRDAILDAKHDKQVVSNNGVFRPMIVIDGQVAGILKKTIKKGAIIITPNLFKPLTATEKQALEEAANQYGAFLGLPVEVE